MTVFDLWLPIVVTGIVCHIGSTLAWIVLPHHKPEWVKLPIEEELQSLIADKNVAAGQYLFPFTQDPQQMKSDEFRTKQAKCRGTLILWEAPVNMGVAIGQTLVFFLLVAFVIGYLASLALPAGAAFMKVFQFVATAGLLAHCAGEFPGVFWFKRKVLMDLVDKIVYGFATGLIFASLWPAA